MKGFCLCRLGIIGERFGLCLWLLSHVAYNFFEVNKVSKGNIQVFFR